MISFQKLMEIMDQPSPLMDSGDESKGMKAIRTGKSFDKNGNSFWDQFLLLCNDPESLSNLLGVKPSQISSWSNKIRNGLKDVERHDQQGTNKALAKDKLMPTGDDWAASRSTQGD